MTVSSVDQTSINSTSQSIRQFFNLQTTHQTQPPQIITSNNSDQELTLVQKPQTPQEQSPLLSTSYQPRSTQNPSCLSPTSHHPSHSPDLRRHSSTPHLSLSAAPQTVIDSDQSKYQAAQPTSSDHQFLDVDHNPNHRMSSKPKTLTSPQLDSIHYLTLHSQVTRHPYPLLDLTHLLQHTIPLDITLPCFISPPLTFHLTILLPETLFIPLMVQPRSLPQPL